MLNSALLAISSGALIACLTLRHVLHPPLPTVKDPLRFYSTSLKDDLHLVLLRAIENAKEHITLQAYALGDKSLIAALEKRAAEGIEVHIFYDASACPSLPKGTRMRCYPITSHALFHRKLLLIDDQISFIGSANFTTTSLLFHENIVLGLYQPTLTKELRLCHRQQSHHSSDKREIDLWIFPEASNPALKELLAALQNAKRRIVVGMYSLSHPALIEALSIASERGIAVSLYLERETTIPLSSGVRVYVSRGAELRHHKFAWIDDHLWLGSANWTQAAFKNNYELLARITPAPKHWLQCLCAVMRLESALPNA